MVCDGFVTLVGSLISCVRPNEVVKLPYSLSVSTFNKSLLKSPSKINSLFSSINLSINSSNLSLYSTRESGGLYMFPTKNDLLLGGEISNQIHDIL